MKESKTNKKNKKEEEKETKKKATAKKSQTTKKTTKTKSSKKNQSKKKVKEEPKTEQKQEIKEEPKKKEKKKNKKQEKLIDPTVNQDNEMSKLLKIVIVVTIIMALFYLVTVIVTKKSDEVTSSKTTSSSDKKTSIQYENIIIGSMLNFDGNYYVLIEKDDDENKTELDSLVSSANEKDGDYVYKANLTDSFNKSYLSDKNNYDKEDISKFKVSGTTLVRVEDHKITDIYDKFDDIKAKLDSLK